MPQPIPIALNYAPSANAFGPQPHSVKVRAGDTLVFTRGTGAAADHKIRITIADTQNFSPAQVHHSLTQQGDEPLRVAVTNNLPAGTTYLCELLDKDLNPVLDGNGHPISAQGGGGGEIEPDTGL